MDEIWETLYGKPTYLSSYNTTTCFRKIIFAHPGAKFVSTTFIS
jgi:hypothetical protein